ncbi:MAG: pseudaminic acid synthase [Pseudobdellovibrionaceae bacterium]
MNSEIKIGKFKVGPSHPPFIIAEMSGNHGGSLEKALNIVRAVAKTGAQCLKLQTYTAETMTLPLSTGDFYIDDKKSLWHGSNLFDLYKKAHTPWDWHKPIFNLANELGLVAFSTPFDETAVDFLESLHVPAYKVASFENTDHKLIRKVAKTGKPMIISTGMAELHEISESVKVARDAGCKDLILLKCTSSYPASPAESNLRTIPALAQNFQCQSGLSDHTLGMGAAVASVALGGTVIEKHFIDTDELETVDSAFSLTTLDFKKMVDDTKTAWESLGSVSFGPSAAEKDSLRFRRTLYCAKDVKKGERFTPENVRAIRPGFGLPVKFYEQVVGRTAAKDIKTGERMSWDLIGL